MKTKQILFLLLIVLSFSAIAKESNDALRDKVLNKLSKNVKIEFSDDRKYNGKITVNTEYETVVYQEWVENQWLNSEKEILTYNFTEGFIEMITQEYLEGNWVNDDKSVLEFEINNADSTFRFLKVFFYQWNSGTNEWNLSGRSVYNYDSNNYLLSVQQFINFGGQEIQYSLVEYTNNSVGKPLEKIVKYLDFSNMQLQEASKTVYVYDSGNQHYLQMETEYLFEDGVFVEDMRYTYTRNSLLYPLTEIMEYYGNGSFQIGSKLEYSYLPNNKDLTQILQFVWNGSVYENSSREVYTYTSFNKKEIYTYEVFTNGNFNPWLKTTYTYDNQNREIEALTQIFVAGNFESADYQNSYRELTSYEPTSVKDEELIIKGFTLNNNYPNPFNPSTVISYQITELSKVKLTVYDILGNEIAVLVNKEQNAGEYNIEFNGAGLSSGVYFYQIQVGSFFETKKMILNK